MSTVVIFYSELADKVRELKYADDGNMETACGEALKQIEEKKYAEGLKWRGVKEITK